MKKRNKELFSLKTYLVNKAVKKANKLQFREQRRQQKLLDASMKKLSVDVADEEQIVVEEEIEQPQLEQ